MKALSIGFIIGAFIGFFIFIVGQARQNLTHTCAVEQIPTDNELIWLNDSTAYRIHVRIDTTYFYADR